MILLAFSIVAADPGSAAPAASLQTQFEQASVALDANKPAEALAIFREIEARPSISARTRGLVLMREGSALAGLHRDDEAVAAYRKGLGLVAEGDATAREDRRSAWIGLAEIAKSRNDYVAARAAFDTSLRLSSDPAAKIQALLGSSIVAMFDENQAALASINQALAIAAVSSVSKPVAATLHDIRGRVLLNAGNQSGALDEFLLALKDQGGLTEKTDLRDVMVRSDVALAYMLAKKEDRALEYFGMTGQGRLPDGPFATAAKMDPPPCGGDLHPEDRAVVEFGIADNGSVSYAQPVYASRLGRVGPELARAVAAWSWRPGEVAKIPAFYRLVTRVEIRCSLAAERPADMDLLLPEASHWLSARGNPFDNSALSSGSSSAPSRSDLDAAEKAGTSRPILIGQLMTYAAAPSVDLEERSRVLDHALELAIADQASPSLIAYLTLSAGLSKPLGRPEYYQKRTALARALLAQPRMAEDPRTADTLRLILGAPKEGGGYEADAERILDQVVGDPRLQEKDPLKVGALVRLATFQAQQGQLDVARATYLKSGLDAQQCSLVDAQPAISKTGVRSGDYPMDMVMMRVSGWTRIEFDILPDGTTVNRRPVISYPPLIFGESTTKAMAKTRFTQTYRPNGALGCGGAALNFRYLVPNS